MTVVCRTVEFRDHLLNVVDRPRDDRHALGAHNRRYFALLPRCRVAPLRLHLDGEKEPLVAADAVGDALARIAHILDDGMPAIAAQRVQILADFLLGLRFWRHVSPP